MHKGGGEAEGGAVRVLVGVGEGVGVGVLLATHPGSAAAVVAHAHAPRAGSTAGDGVSVLTRMSAARLAPESAPHKRYCPATQPDRLTTSSCKQRVRRGGHWGREGLE